MSGLYVAFATGLSVPHVLESHLCGVSALLPFHGRVTFHHVHGPHLVSLSSADECSTVWQL